MTDREKEAQIRRQIAFQASQAMANLTAQAMGITVEELRRRTPMIDKWAADSALDDMDFVLRGR